MTQHIARDQPRRPKPWYIALENVLGGSIALASTSLARNPNITENPVANAIIHIRMAAGPGILKLPGFLVTCKIYPSNSPVM